MSARTGFRDRVLAEAVRVEEEVQGSLHPDTEVGSPTRMQGMDLEQRLILRARATPNSAVLARQLRRLRAVLLLTLTLVVLAGALTGAGTAAAALGTGGNAQVNVYIALTAILGVNLLALIAWLLLVAFRPGADATTSLGGLAWLVSRHVGRWLNSGSPGWKTAVKALALSSARSGAARWGLSAISHAFWTAFIGAAILTTVFLLGTKQYVFTWETTILSADRYVSLTQTLAGAPAALGFPVPALQEIEASRWTGEGSIEGGSAAEAWSGFVVGSLVIYGLLPRLLLTLLCLVWMAAAARRYRLDLDLPAFAMLSRRLDPDARRLGVSDADRGGAEASPAPRTLAPRARGNNAAGAPAILGLEIQEPATGWPPLAAETQWLDLGLVDSREQRQASLRRLNAALPPPQEVVVVCSLAATPDRGSQRFLGLIAQGNAAAVLLTEGDELRRQGAGESVERRAADWRAAAQGAGISGQRVLEIDLDHLTENSARRLRGFLDLSDNSGALPNTASTRLTQAFAAIVEAVGGWQHYPDPEDQAELHRNIARLYQGHGNDWKTLLGAAGTGSIGEPLQLMRGGADRVLALLPLRLRGNGRWLASGAIAGAMACVAAATLAAPAALAALPAWAGMGGALSLLLRERLTAKDAEPDSQGIPVDLGEAVQAAALFAVLLELQGRDEARITQILDQVFDIEVPGLRTAAEAEEWLRTVHQRMSSLQDSP